MNDLLPRRLNAAHSTLHILYRFFDAEGALLYVGMTNNPAVRFTEHKGVKGWWAQVATITLQHVGSRQELRRQEAEAIRSENPRYNKSGAQRPVVIPDKEYNLVEVGEMVAAARQRVADATADCAKFAREAAAEGVPETVIAKKLDVDRGTVRRWIGKQTF